AGRGRRRSLRRTPSERQVQDREADRADLRALPRDPRRLRRLGGQRGRGPLPAPGGDAEARRLREERQDERAREHRDAAAEDRAGRGGAEVTKEQVELMILIKQGLAPAKKKAKR